MKVSIAKAAQILGVSITTLRRWDIEGKLKAERTPAGHRRYDLAKLQRLVGQSALVGGETLATAVYARVADTAETDQLTGQIQQLTSYCQGRGWEPQVYSDTADEANGRLPGLVQLIKKICAQELKRLVLFNHDRLSRPGLDLILTLCSDCEVELIILNKTTPNSHPVQTTEAVVGQILAALG